MGSCLPFYGFDLQIVGYCHAVLIYPIFVLILLSFFMFKHTQHALLNRCIERKIKEKEEIGKNKARGEG